MTTVRASLLLAAWVSAALLPTPSRADVSLAPLFVDGAVLQRERTVPIWGRADPGEKIVVQFAGQRHEATGSPDGRWLALLEPMPASAQPADLVVAGHTTLVVREVLVGDVWLCVGEAGMEWPVRLTERSAEEIAAAQFPLIRHLKIERAVAESAAETVRTSGWQTASPATVGEFGAVAWFFARDLHPRLGVPLGLVNASCGGSPIEAWLSPAAYLLHPELAIADQRWTGAQAAYPMLKAQSDRASDEWIRAEAVARARGRAVLETFLRRNPRPTPPPGGPDQPWAPRALFNGMINPLLPFALRGVLWDQGESNVERPGEYGAQFAALVETWRAHLGQPETPFFWVNLAAFRHPNDPTGTRAAALREAQTRALALPHTGQAIAIDTASAAAISSRNTAEIGRRLALLAYRRVYGGIGDDAGPTFAGATREGRGLRVRFSHAGGLIAYNKPVQALQLAGADRVFHPAEARIEGDTLLVTARAVPEPAAVRYAWFNAPEANLYNGAGLPAAPFRSDDW